MITFKKMSKVDKEMLEGMMVGFLHTQCYAFALAIHKGLGWELCGLMNGEVIQHVGARDIIGRFFDARGFVEESKIIEPFRGEFSVPCQFKSVTPQELHAAKPVHEETVASARRYAELLWPELPWPDTERQYMMSFLEALEDLCKARGFFIRGSVPGSPVILERIQGDEAGFCLGMNLVNGGHFDRVLKQNE